MADLGFKSERFGLRMPRVPPTPMEKQLIEQKKKSPNIVPSNGSNPYAKVIYPGSPSPMPTNAPTGIAERLAQLRNKTQEPSPVPQSSMQVPANNAQLTALQTKLETVDARLQALEAVSQGKAQEDEIVEILAGMNKAIDALTKRVDGITEEVKASMEVRFQQVYEHTYFFYATVDVPDLHVLSKPESGDVIHTFQTGDTVVLFHPMLPSSDGTSVWMLTHTVTPKGEFREGHICIMKDGTEQVSSFRTCPNK